MTKVADIVTEYLNTYQIVHAGTPVNPLVYEGYHGGYHYFKHGEDTIKYRRKQVIENTQNLKTQYQDN